MSKKIRATAKVQAMLEVRTGDVWGQDCQMEQVYKQGEEAARDLILHWIQESEKKGIIARNCIRIAGALKVIAVMTEEDS